MNNYHIDRYGRVVKMRTDLLVPRSMLLLVCALWCFVGFGVGWLTYALTGAL